MAPVGADDRCSRRADRGHVCVADDVVNLCVIGGSFVFQHDILVVLVPVEVRVAHETGRRRQATLLWPLY